ncbi:Formin-like protein 2 [Takifugu flavidus]|uniref:Formin-like protein 2 n=1 Tax=Takifugu flavidus TaxID=433684 RepID=A0A5C6PR35_9TELE|nr:Formin-like protein 2 [Takifugu flavidus]
MGNAGSMEQHPDFRGHNMPLKLPMPDPGELEERFASVLINNFSHFTFFTDSTSAQTLSQARNIWPGWSSSPPLACRLFYLDSFLLLQIISIMLQHCGAHPCDGRPTPLQTTRKNSMNLPPDKARLLRQYDNEKKWELICDQPDQEQQCVHAVRRAVAGALLHDEEVMATDRHHLPQTAFVLADSKETASGLQSEILFRFEVFLCQH